MVNSVPFNTVPITLETSVESSSSISDEEARALLPQSRQAEITYTQYRAYGLSPAHALDAVQQVWRAIWR